MFNVEVAQAHMATTPQKICDAISNTMHTRNRASLRY
jgi:hypothetical protein